MSIFRDPRCVFVADTLGLAESTVLRLGHDGIRAEVMKDLPPVLAEITLPIAASTSPMRGYEVWVSDPADTDRALEVLDAIDAVRHERADKTGLMIFNCDECGQQLAFPADQEGTVQECTHCNAYVDVPDSKTLDEDDADYGEPEPEPADE